MSDWPKTKEEARKVRYRQWAGNPNGTPYDPNSCAADIPDGGRSVLFHQCRNPNGHGADGLYCKRHAKYMEKYGL